jgi:enoyl-CoA hydratase/carnithine racemase
MGEFVRVEKADGIATIRLDRPKMNALNSQVQEEIRACAREVGADPDVAAVIVYGGERVFAAGADVKEMAEMGYAEMAARSKDLQDCFTAVTEIPQPTISAITGYALGGGLELAMCTDFRVCGAGAKVGQPEILLGIIPGAGGTQRLPRLVGPAKAKDIIFSGRFVDAEEAERIGPARRQGVRGPGHRDRPAHRPGDRAHDLRGPVRHRGPDERHAVVRRERSGEGQVHRTLTDVVRVTLWDLATAK